MTTPNDCVHRDDGITEIFLNSRKYGRVPVLVSTIDYYKYNLESYRWTLFTSKSARTRYAHTKAPHPSGGLTKKGLKRTRSIFLHSLIMETPKGMHTDHINGQGLDNRKENLRVCTPSQNFCNQKVKRSSRSGYKCVYEIRKPYKSKYTSKKTGKTYYREYMPSKRWVAYITHPEKQGRNIKLGYFDTAEEAAQAYDLEALRRFGEFARLNFPEKVNQYEKEIHST